MQKVDSDGTKQTWTGIERQTRVDAVKAEIKSRKRMSKDEVFKFCLKQFGVSTRVIKEYLDELALLDLIKSEMNGEEEIIVWRGGE